MHTTDNNVQDKEIKLSTFLPSGSMLTAAWPPIIIQRTRDCLQMLEHLLVKEVPVHLCLLDLLTPAKVQWTPVGLLDNLMVIVQTLVSAVLMAALTLVPKVRTMDDWIRDT